MKTTLNLSKLILTVIVSLSLFASCDRDKEAYSPQRSESDSLFIVNNYDKTEVYIPMRDGTQLFTSIYTPNDGQAYPIILFRTPYSVAPYGTDKSQYRKDLGPNMSLTKDKYIFVYQDVRGKFMSEGDFVNMTPHEGIVNGRNVNESTDTFDTIDWLLSHTQNNGNVGQWGISYPGFYTAAGMIDSHPALKAVSPQAPIADWFFDDFHHHGAFFPSHSFAFLSSFGVERDSLTTEWAPDFNFGTEDGYEFYKNMTPLSKANELYLHDSIPFWNEMVAHPNYDEYWQSKNILPHLKNVNCAVLTVGGWYDAEDLYGPLHIYAEVEKNNPKTTNTIIMGPWSHGGWRRTAGDFLGDVHFGEKTSTFFNNEVLTPFFTYHLKGEGEADLSEAIMFETGRNQWRKFEEWPPKNLDYRKLYFKKKNELSFTPPQANEFGVDMFVSDPANPVPFTQYPNLKIPKEYMVEDQGFVILRDDVLYYVTAQLEEDLTVAGPIIANLVVKTNQSAADWIVKIIDVYPNDHAPYPHQPEKMIGGYHQMVRSEALRGRFRNSYKKPEPFTPKQDEKIELELQDVLHTFKKGHRIMVQIQSTWFPLIDINPQTYVDNIFEASAEDFVVAKHAVSRSGSNPSYIKIGVLSKE
ncbi:CocE/NonD family hydrolase [Reichenbachiella agarivorans]|uniref:CocE/NonD family hydrolase n=1 Tax=Reichenbachiella agarivorans TaxID=2979464 RepID=A0ABY6CMM5_9BACT|nr:CocE/NonD family hydrolase [Reichenbachiella agarivorans]UXP30728.1 CocE/NonD family hydrolase [Reichenbachiella agarivorans]